jgi:hypothetical protein
VALESIRGLQDLKRSATRATPVIAACDIALSLLLRKVKRGSKICSVTLHYGMHGMMPVGRMITVCGVILLLIA